MIEDFDEDVEEDVSIRVNHIPDEDEYDEFDEIEERIAQAERKRKGRVNRGSGMFGVS